MTRLAQINQQLGTMMTTTALPRAAHQRDRYLDQLAQLMDINVSRPVTIRSRCPQSGMESSARRLRLPSTRKHDTATAA